MAKRNFNEFKQAWHDDDTDDEGTASEDERLDEVIESLNELHIALSDVRQKLNTLVSTMPQKMSPPQAQSIPSTSDPIKAPTTTKG